MITATIFSKDRALQLKLLLTTIEKFAPGIFEINVIYKSSDDFYQEGYDKLIFECNNESIGLKNINWLKEDKFKEQVLSCFNENKLSCFFTDDDLFFDTILEQEITDLINSDPDIFCFSLRLGKNVNHCYTLNCPNVLIPLSENQNSIVWDWTKHYADFGYPLSVDGHIFKTNDLKKLISKINFNNPNTLEIALQIFDNYPKSKMVSYLHSKLVNSPTNMVQNVIENRSGELFGHDTKYLNDLYLDEYIINTSHIDFNSINSCHQELEFTFSEALKSPQYKRKQYIKS